MYERMTVGAACIIGMAALASGPAAAATLTGFAGFADIGYQSGSGNGGSNPNTAFVDGGVAGPLGVPNLNFQVDVGGFDTWATHTHTQSGIGFGGNLFWAGNDGRIGVRGEYDTAGHSGGTGGATVFGEWYFGVLTGMAKAGYINQTGSGLGGRGGVFGAALEAYFMPNLALRVGATSADVVTGQGCQICGRGDENTTGVDIAAEFLLANSLGAVPWGGGLSVFGSYAYDQFHDFGFKSHENVWMIGLRWYTGGGSLMDLHRNGNLNPWLATLVDR